MRANNPKRQSRRRRELKAPTGLAFDPATTPAVYLEYAEQTCGVKPQYPVTTQDALNLLTVAGYQADHSRLTWHYQQGYITKPEKRGNAYYWTRENIYEFCGSLESTRNWQPVHELHRHKMNAREIEQGEYSPVFS